MVKPDIRKLLNCLCLVLMFSVGLSYLDYFVRSWHYWALFFLFPGFYILYIPAPIIWILKVVVGFNILICRLSGLSQFFLTCCLIPILEELEFRLPLLLLRGRCSNVIWYSVATAISLVFTIGHMGYPLSGMLLIGAFATLACYLVKSTGKLRYSIAFHMLYNLAMTLLSFI